MLGLYYTSGIRSQEFDLGCVVRADSLGDPPVASVTMIIFFIVKETYWNLCDIRSTCTMFYTDDNCLKINFWHNLLNSCWDANM